MKKTLIYIAIAFVLVAASGTGIFFYLDYRKHAPQREDYAKIESEIYDSVFLSTFPIDNYSEYDYEFYRGIYLLKTAYCIPDMETLEEYLLKISESGNEISTIYLGIRPDIITADDLLFLKDQYPDKCFEVIMAYPSLEYWTSLKEEEYSEQIRKYKDFVYTLMPICRENDLPENALNLYFYNSYEWLTGNPANYESSFSVNSGIAHVLSLNSDPSHDYILLESNYKSVLNDFENMVERYRSTPPVYPELDNWDIVFFGDSVIAVEDTSSIPDALSGLTGAHTYNCARGGTSATRDPESDLPGISEVVDAFMTKDLSQIDQNTLTYKGISDYFNTSRKKSKKCFILSFGLNDYFNGYAICSDDPHDTRTYAGALRTSVETLRSAYPDSYIVLVTPNHAFLSESTINSLPINTPLSDYADAVISLSEEMGTLLCDYYNELAIDNDNWQEYIPGGVHPNAFTRLQMVRQLSKLLQTVAVDR